MRFHNSLLWTILLVSPAAVTAQTQDDLFDDSVVHEVRMTMDPTKWQTLLNNILDSTDYPVDTFVWKGPRNLSATLNDITIHSRGYGSRDARKPGLHVGFDGQVTGQNLLGESSLELKSNTDGDGQFFSN